MLTSLPVQSPATPAALQSTPLIRHLAPSWRLMLLSDGSVTRHLSLLTGQPVRIECLEMRPIGSRLGGLVPSVDRIPGPRLQRQVQRLPPVVSCFLCPYTSQSRWQSRVSEVECTLDTECMICRV